MLEGILQHFTALCDSIVPQHERHRMPGTTDHSPILHVLASSRYSEDPWYRHPFKASIQMSRI